METEATFSPPYNIPWTTFLSIIEKVAADLPNKIDRSYLDSRSGSEQSYLIAAFKGFNLIGDDYKVKDELRELASAGDERPAKIAELLQKFYPDAVKLGETNSTMGELESAFAEAYPRIGGASRTKAIRFFLFAMEYAQLPKSPLWKVAKASASGRRAGSRRSRSAAASSGNGTGNAATPKPSQTSEEARRQAYFDLLLEKAKTAEDDKDILDRIEKLLDEKKDA